MNKYLPTFILFMVLILPAFSINLPPFPSISSLPYQAHSFNDAPYLRQLLRRGVRYFKVDASISNRESCIKNSDWNPSSKCYKTGLYAEEFCCIAMRGDTSGMFSFDFPFSTMDNFLDTVQKYIVENGISKILFFAVNFQFGFQFSNQLAENALYRMAKLMEKYPKLYFGTGTDNFILEYDRVCRKYVNQTEKSHDLEREPLESLNEQACTDKRKLISSSRFFLQSGAYDPSDPRDYYGRYRNFNVFYKQVIHYCENGFPLWIKKHPEFPLIFWQPSDERQIQMVLETFLSEKCRKHHGRDIDGLAITSNIDPEVFEFYLKRINETSSLNPMVFYPNNQKIALPHSRNFLSKLLANNSEFLIFGHQNDLDNLDKKKGASLEIILLTQSQNSEKIQEIRRRQLAAVNGTIKILQGNNTFVVVQKHLQNQLQRNVSLSLLNMNLQIVGDRLPVEGFFDICYLNGFYYILRQTTNPSIFNVLKANNDFTKTSIILSFSEVLEKAKSIESFIVAQDNAGKISYFVSGSLKGSVWIGEIENNNIYKSKQVSFGQNSKLTMKTDGMLMITMQNGVCNSGVQINNGDVPLCHLFKFPQFKPMTSTTGTTTLIQVTLTNLIQFLQKQSSDPVTACTEKFIHSKVFNGRNVHVVDLWSRLFFVTEYVHISQFSMLNSLFCAPSNFGKLKDNKKGMLGTIWSRGNTGEAKVSSIKRLERKQFELIKQ